MDILYEDARILVCIKPAGVVSAGDDEGSMVDLLRKELSDAHACVRSVHRLDAQVSGLMVFARSQAAASILSEQVRTRAFEKEYLAVVHGRFKESAGQMEDLLWYNPLAAQIARHAGARQGCEAGAAVLRGSGVLRRPGRFSCQNPAAHRKNPSDSRPVCIERSCAARRPEVRRGRTGRLPDRALVLQALVSAPAKRAAGCIFFHSAAKFPLVAV